MKYLRRKDTHEGVTDTEVGGTHVVQLEPKLNTKLGFNTTTTTTHQELLGPF